MPISILVVEDEPEIRELLEFTLNRAGYKVYAVGSAETALTYLNNEIPDAVILDWMLPGQSGVELARRLRKDKITQHLPIMMLTARGEEADKLKSFASGVDDYVTKPFSPKELVARIKALLRRTGVPQNNILEAHGITLNMDSHRICIANAEIHIGPTEFRLLEILMRHPDRAFNRSTLLDHIWGPSAYVEERTVDVHVLRLRKLLAQQGLECLIETVRGVGYRFSPTQKDN